MIRRLTFPGILFRTLAQVSSGLLFLAACGGSGGGGGTVAPPPYQPVLLSRFPVSLDALFRTGDPVRQAQILEGIRTGRPEATMPFLVPYPNYNHSGHFPATMKWYLYTQAATPISLSAPGWLEVRGDEGAALQVLNGVPCLVDITATIHLSYYIRVELGHACIAKTLVDAYHAAGATEVFGQLRQAVPVAADTALGSTLPIGALDFIIHDDSQRNFDPQGLYSYLQTWANPFFYFTPEVQEQLRTYCQPQLAAMAESGLYPESALDRTFAINESGSYFGTWFYRSGPLQPGPSDHPMGWYSFSGCIVNLLDVARTEPATFWKDANTGQPFGPDMVGVFCDATFTGTMPGFTPPGRPLPVPRGRGRTQRHPAPGPLLLQPGRQPRVPEGPVHRGRLRHPLGRPAGRGALRHPRGGPGSVHSRPIQLQPDVRAHQLRPPALTSSTASSTPP